jgi:uncharacterized SAM-binding protein YcdF (DUF218 family)
MLISKLNDQDLTAEIIDRILFHGIVDTGDPADCIIVLGSKKAAEYRVPLAVEAYKAGRSSKIMLCGGKLREFPNGHFTESQHMLQAVLEQGVDEENIILENASQNTIENILFALIKLQRAFWLNKVHSVLLVTTAYHMRRSLAISRYLFPKHITVIPCPANDTHTCRNNWMTTDKGINRAKGEAQKVIQYVKSGIIPDFEI